MSLSSIQCYAEPEQLEQAHAVTRVQLTPTRPGPFHARVTRIEFANLWLHQVSEGTPRIKYAEQTPDRMYIKFLSQPGQTLVIQGVMLPFTAIMGHGQGDCYYEHTSGPITWASMSLPLDGLLAAGIAVSGRELTRPRHPHVIVPLAHTMTKLRQLHGEAATLAETAPQLLATPQVEHALEQSLIETMVNALSGPDAQRLSWARRCHHTVMRRYHNLLDDHPDRPLYIPEVCAAIRVPERTLRLCCQEQLGMSPKRFLLLRRLHQVNRVLRTAHATETTVTEVATRFGFWHFGRFAGSYRATFGETPSVTLHRTLH